LVARATELIEIAFSARSEGYLAPEPGDLEQTSERRAAPQKRLYLLAALLSVNRVWAADTPTDPVATPAPDAPPADANSTPPDAVLLRLLTPAQRNQWTAADKKIKDAVTAGARLVVGGKYEGNFYYPTVVADVTPEMAAFRDELFGPVAAVTKAKDADHALALANNSQYGLSSAVLTNNLQLAMKFAMELEAGMVHINDTTVSDEPHVPFGGVGWSGLGRHGGKAGIDQFTEMRWITLERGGRHYPPPFLMNPGH